MPADTPTIPTCAALASAVVVDAYDDMVNPPGLTNHVVTAQVDHDVVAVRSVHAPPLVGGDRITGQLFVEGRLARSYGGAVATQWRPDRVERRTSVAGYEIATTTVCPPGANGVVVHVRVESEHPMVELGFWLDSAVTRAQAWRNAETPTTPNTLAFAPGREGTVVVGAPQDGAAVCVQGVDVPSGTVIVGEPRLLQVELTLTGGSAELTFAVVLGTDAEAAVTELDALLAAPELAVAASEREWNRELAALFDDDDETFAGSLPVLHTDDDALRTLYWWGAMGVLWFRRTNPASVLGTTYDTLMPRYWVTTTFLWDYSLSSHVHAQLEPDVMKRHIRHWVSLDLDKHFGTEWLTGGPVGYWYSVNHYAMTRLVRDYVAFTGDVAFLDEVVATADGGERRMGDHVREWARAWHRLRGASGLADYGEIDNLLECVSTYTHEVASLNAANVWCLRTAADVADLEGDSDGAARLRGEAEDLVALVLGRYVDGAGYFLTGRSDGSEVPTRHCYDFATVGTTIAADLPEHVRDEMVAFFVRELRTPSWMRALSPWDPDAAYSLRADHQWNGAYPAWPADSARAAIALGHPEAVLEWLPGLARTANQGPPGQAHFVEEAAEPVDGGARKTPPQFPYLIDWACSSAGSWVELVVGALFGVEVGLDGSVTASGPVPGLDPGARLTGLRVAGRTYDVDASGLVAR
ncbi:conserved hypothetical protein [Beutenbergia cavernae DSM 12333]|uniref:Alpha-L-rhamnosidase six-hairpin glycosidase domain-containing protein n=1 Tax=Beutenbergia cavernae (strain ATCC BAA-8 / DSM 12333 / CCUG 43141 / JCM 11478 / NBRC 16432 / NCIMB 13614 / HKI 0122) TaxID=471853 RepID=C5BY43_BEUC1|nr:hypothetical protein [Beutenbergia cavernae]ACQ80943.1 conserved hypothetical protein [Beutenbergia cavernae DSM 12333]